MLSIRIRSRVSPLFLAVIFLFLANAQASAQAFDIAGTLTHLCDLKREPGKIPESFERSSRQNPFIGVWHGHWSDDGVMGMEQTFSIYATKDGRPFIYAAQGAYPKWDAEAKCDSFVSAAFDGKTITFPAYKSGGVVTLTLSADGRALDARFKSGASTEAGRLKLVFEPGFRDQAELRKAGMTD